MQFTENYKDVVKRWNAGETVWTAELGGLGPGYEQAIQVLLFETLNAWGDQELQAFDGYDPEYEKIFNQTADKMSGLSGAQASAAKATAYQFIRYGYDQMMNKLGLDRKIQVSKDWPKFNDTNKTLDQ